MTSQPDGWRLPTVEEFRELFAGEKPEEGLFPGREWAWSASPFADFTDYAWVVSFCDDCVNWNNKLNGYPVRLVRGQ